MYQGRAFQVEGITVAEALILGHVCMFEQEGGGQYGWNDVNKRESGKLHDENRRFLCSEPVVEYWLKLCSPSQGLGRFGKGVGSNGGHDLRHVLKKSFSL